MSNNSRAEGCLLVPEEKVFVFEYDGVTIPQNLPAGMWLAGRVAVMPRLFPAKVDDNGNKRPASYQVALDVGDMQNVVVYVPTEIGGKLIRGKHVVIGPVRASRVYWRSEEQ